MNAPAPYGGGVFIVDKSAWVRVHREPSLQGEWIAALRADQIRTCAPTKLEILYSTETSALFEAWREVLDALTEIAVNRTVCNAALTAMRELAAGSDGNHRVDLPDYLIAAAAQNAGVGVLHQDNHYDKLATVMSFESRWLDPTKSIA